MKDNKTYDFLVRNTQIIILLLGMFLGSAWGLVLSQFIASTNAPYLQFICRDFIPNPPLK